MIVPFKKPEPARDSPATGVLSPKMEAAALAMAKGCNLRDAARESGAGERTIKTWTATSPAFTHRINDLRGEMTARALGRLVDAMTSAADTLGYLSRKGKSETVRLSASRTVLEMASKLRETWELEQRIIALEKVKGTKS